MKLIIIFCGIILFSFTVEGQYIYKPKTTGSVSNKKTYQYTPAASQKNAAAPVSNTLATANSSRVSTTNQVKTISVPASKWINFKGSALYRTRQAKFAAAYQNPSKSYTMDDGSRLTLTFQKNPSFGGMANQINTQTSPGAPIHGSSNSNSNQSGWNCTTNNITVTAKSTDFDVADYSQQAAHIYPGAIYTFNNYSDGSFASPSGTRNPITIFTDDRNVNENSVVVNNPDIQSIHNAISELSQHFPTNYSANGATDFSYYESENTAAMAIKATAGGSGYGFSFKAAFGDENNSHERYLTIDAKKILFTISTLPPSNGYYTNASIESTPNLMVMGTVTYGVRILANLTINVSSDSMGMALDAAYNGGTFSANAGLNFLQQNSSSITSVNAYEIGGPNVGAIQIDKTNLINSINSILTGATYQNAQPISYQLYDMAGDVIGSSSATDQFTKQNCTPSANANTPVLTSATITVNCGGDCKDNDTHYEYDLYNTTGQRVGYFRNNNDNTEWPDNSMNQSGNHLAITGSPKLSDFTNGTPTFRMTIYPNGNDDVQMNQVTLTLTFTSPDGSSSQNYSCKWPGVTLTKGGPVANLLFNYSTGSGFQPQGQGN